MKYIKSEEILSDSGWVERSPSIYQLAEHLFDCSSKLMVGEQTLAVGCVKLEYT